MGGASRIASATLVLGLLCGCSSEGGGGGGGGGGGAAGSGGFGGTLEPPYDGPPGAWVDRTPSPIPATWPTAYPYSGLAHDGTRGRVVFVVHGIPEEDFEIWDWDGATKTFTHETPTVVAP